MAGILDWHMLTGRYSESALRRRYQMPPQRLGGPSGLGTSVTFIGELLRALMSTAQAVRI
jgi:germacradienol/geosmin synthase